MIPPRTFAAVLIGLTAWLSGSSVAAIRPPVQTNILDLSPAQRQALLRERLREHQRLLNQRQRALFESQQAIQTQLQAQRELQQAKTQAVWDQYQSGLRRNQAMNQITTASALAESERIKAENIQARLGMVESAIDNWKGPKGYALATGGRVPLSNPFAPDPAEGEEKSNDLVEAVRGTFLDVDLDRSLARVGETIPLGTCGGGLEVGDYPVLADGNLLDTPERVGIFLEACADPTAALFVFRNEVELRPVERSR